MCRRGYAHGQFHLGIKDDIKKAGFYRDVKGSLHLMALTKTTTYDFIIGYQKLEQDLIFLVNQPADPSSSIDTV